MRRTAPYRVLVAGLAALPLLAAPAAAPAQDVSRELRESQQRLQQIREERRALETQMNRLRSQVHDAAVALRNVERQAAVSAAVLEELELQAVMIDTQIDQTTIDLAESRQTLERRTRVLHDRLRAIYRRGPLHTIRVLFGAESFADLLNRYKYLHLVATHDRMLVREISHLEQELARREQQLQHDFAYLNQLREEKQEEVARLQILESEQERTLERYRQQQREAEGRLVQLARDEAQLNRMIDELERRRVEEERRLAAAGGTARGGLTTRDLGSLAWPVEGDLVYHFGPERRPSGVVLRWNGIGIAAPPGTLVRAVEGGTVAMAGPFEGYGPSVMISHGGGFYTVYLYLSRLRVREGEQVAAGTVLGAVGSGRVAGESLMEFQVWGPVGSATPVPVDPLAWLRDRAGS